MSVRKHYKSMNVGLVMKGVDRVFLGCDHAGFILKEKIIKYLDKNRVKYSDFNPKLIEGDDYPDSAFKVAEAVVRNNSKGILVCGSGTGMAIAANKAKGARAVAPLDRYGAVMSRKDNDANIICLRSRKFPASKSLNLLDAWLKIDFDEAERHKRRIKKIEDYERR